jgi:hypothetical protein
MRDRGAFGWAIRTGRGELGWAQGPFELDLARSGRAGCRPRQGPEPGLGAA